MTGRILMAAGILAGLWFGAQGGEYSTADWWTLKRGVVREQEALARLQADLDSLAAYADSLETNPVTQERVAREKFGMLRDGETLYRVEPAPRP